MGFCTNCGNPLQPEDRFCTNCGTPVESTNTEQTAAGNTPPTAELPTPPTVNVQETLDAVQESVKGSAEKAVQGAQAIATRIGQKVEAKKAEIATRVEAEAQAAQEEQEHRRKLRQFYGDINTRYMSATELWSWLKKDAKRQRFFTEEASTLTEEEFMHKIADKMESNGVPASVGKRLIQWDRSNVKTETYYIKPHTEAVNPLTCLLQFNHVGKFTFVEEKTFITPPNLPQAPETPLPMDLAAARQAVSRIFFGAIALLIGLALGASFSTAAVVLVIVGLAMGMSGLLSYYRAKEIKEHNEKCAKQEAEWEKAWTNWQDSIFLHSFQEDTNGHLSRIFDSVFECIKQVSDEEFRETKSAEQEDSINMNELEQMIARRKADYR